MIAVILAAGISSRLRPLTDDTPKCLLPVGGTPLLERILLSLVRSRIQQCIIVTGYHKEKIEAFVEAQSLPLVVSCVENPHYASTGNNYSLWTVRPHVDGRSMVMMDGDILFDSRLLPLLLNSPHENALVLRQTAHLGKEEIKVELDASGRVRRIGKDIDPAVAAGESIGIERFGAAGTRTLFGILDRRKVHNEFYEASFQEMIDTGGSIHTVTSGNLPCVEIDTPDDLQAANSLAQSVS